MMVIGAGVAGSGCAEAERVPMFTPMREGLGILEANRRLVTCGLKATGSVWLEFVEEGKKRRFDLDAKLQMLPPGHMRFVLQSALGADEVEVGMNALKWWVLLQRPESQYFEGHPGAPGIAIAGNVPLRPEQLIESLGLSELPVIGPGQRVVDEYQQLLFLGIAMDNRWVIEKEYWLDRYEPRLIRRILFRDEEGRVSLSADVSDYREVGAKGLLLPFELRFSWPAEEALMVYEIDRWEERASLGLTHRAFASPRDRGMRVGKMTGER